MVLAPVVDLQSFYNSGTNTLTAIADGNMFEFFINGNLVWTGSDGELSDGRIGLGGYTNYGDAIHYFDNVLVTESADLRNHKSRTTVV